jgi:hypothetical protein
MSADGTARPELLQQDGAASAAGGPREAPTL